MRRHVLALLVAVAALVGLEAPVTEAVVTRASTYRNPVFDTDFPDPFVLATRGAYTAYATNRGANVQVATSPDLVRWTLHGEALPMLPAWATGGYTWAPSVADVGGRYVMYFTARHGEARVPCIGVAVSASPVGPFVSSSGSPFLCQPHRGGSIDPSVFRDDDGSLWLLWKSEGVVAREPTRIWIQRLAASATRLVGPQIQLLRADRRWEGPIVENPSMVRIGGRLHLFYSANRWETRRYAIGHATCAGPAGPCAKAPGPWVASTSAVAGPGGQEFIRMLDGTVWMSYHGWDPARVGYPLGARSLRIDKVKVDRGRPSVQPTAHDTPFSARS